MLVDSRADVAGLQRRCARQSREMDIAFDVGFQPMGLSSGEQTGS